MTFRSVQIAATDVLGLASDKESSRILSLSKLGFADVAAVSRSPTNPDHGNAVARDQRPRGFRARNFVPKQAFTRYI